MDALLIHTREKYAASGNADLWEGTPDVKVASKRSQLTDLSLVACSTAAA